MKTIYVLMDNSKNITSCLFDSYPGATMLEVADDYNTSQAIYSKLIDGELVYDPDRETAARQAMADAMTQ